MKKSTTIISPFILLLIPVFICMALLHLNKNNEIAADKWHVSSTFKLLTVKALFNAAF